MFVHPWDMPTHPYFIAPFKVIITTRRMQDYWFPWLIGMPCETTVAISTLILGGVLQRHPSLKISFAHGCGNDFFYAIRMTTRHLSVYYGENRSWTCRQA